MQSKQPAEKLDEQGWLTRYAAIGLIVIGGLEWLFGRVVSRFAAIPPLEGIGRTIIEALGRTGIFLISTAFILAITLYFAATLKLGERANRTGDVGGLALAMYLTLFGVFLGAHALLTALNIFGDTAWLDVTFNILAIIALWWLALRFILQRRSTAVDAQSSPLVLGALKVGVLFTALAYSAWYYSVLYSWLSGPGATGAGGPADALRIGEIAAVLAPFAYFAANCVPSGEWRNAKRWILPVVVFVLFAAGNIADIAANVGYTGVFAIWSEGFTLWMPWPIYGLSLSLFLYTLLTCFTKRNEKSGSVQSVDIGMGLLLLLFAGYYLQLTYQHLLALLALSLITGIATPFQYEAERKRYMVRSVEYEARSTK